MNLFNCFQAMAFYTLAPFGIAYLFQNHYDVWGYIAAVGQFAGYVTVSVMLHDSK
jgi:hypothetical protein